MAIVQGYVDSYFVERDKGTHDWSSDTFKIALFDSSATLDGDTTAYSTANEISGTGYTAGGATLAVSSGYPQAVAPYKSAVTFDDVSWASASFTAYGALVYNSSKSNKAVIVLKFPSAGLVVSNGTFKIVFPADLIRSS